MEKDWEDLVHTGPGTLAGRYLRSFWQPIFVAEDLPPGRAVPVRIMSEEFTLYRGESGALYTVEARCAHRRTPLHVGWVEEDCIRCLYHGWKYDGTGQCVEQPGEPESFTTKVKISSYPTQEYLGLVWAYLGEGEAPPIRRFPDFEKPGVLTVTPKHWPCNYFNRLDNACDVGHVSFTHHASIARTGATYRAAVPQTWVEETEYGIRIGIRRQGQPTRYQHFHMPNANQVRSEMGIVVGSREESGKLWSDSLRIRVPVDDVNSVNYVVYLVPLTGEAAQEYLRQREEAQSLVTTPLNEVGEAVLAGRMRIQDVDERLSTFYSFWIEDYVTQVGQGAIVDYASERLGRMDEGVILLRKTWQRELRALAEGRPIKQWSTPEGLAEMSDLEELVKRH